MSLPFLDLIGNTREQGRGHGEALREDIAHNLEVYFERFEKEAGIPRDELLRRAGHGLEALREQAPDYVEGMEGIADASKRKLSEIAMLNLRYELLYHAISRLKIEGRLRPPSQDGCTAFALLPEATENGHLLLGQNWDWIPACKGALIRSDEPGGPRFLGFTEAGIFGAKIGMNDEGLGLAINGMGSTEDDWARMEKPFHLRCHEILGTRKIDDAVSVLCATPRSCTANFLLAQSPARAMDIELAPTRHRTLEAEGGVLVHANHFVDPVAAGVVEPPDPRRHLSQTRHARLEELLHASKPVSAVKLRSHLRDHEVNHPNSLCRHPDTELPDSQRIISKISIIMDLDERRFWVTDGQPCMNEYERYEL
ncbi:MAG: C45 family autoproteolytic acyltransferase/hydrolase [Candidatus Krumholzibacteria bacterium]|nr:C45 family autoproteolytic acyltransferase/hydrolase [Candidatus Krumholzibacteria bacterium]MDP6668359.1 C45 family autoproteolytic acyltransferase/hydrolase [Candidatus Krumholzibacteria bacterium]MDP6796282.1 C45 family autoproteolytic acyltransferase/hydrolase [Candidatus Krumholzibacteria bacterium]MDP7022186.1 C45 family autoproteolytic acyltransferase/hydrolase [Candidatus Krumholzibacteria bacterium]